MSRRLAQENDPDPAGRSTFRPPNRVNSPEEDYLFASLEEHYVVESPLSDARYLGGPRDHFNVPPAYSEVVPPPYSKKDTALQAQQGRARLQILSPEEIIDRCRLLLDKLRPLVYVELEADEEDLFEIQAKQVEDPAPGTCQWIYDKELFKDWRDRKRSNVLLILAPAGSGKSVLAKSVSTTLQKPDEQALCFYCSRSFASRNTSRSIIATFICKFIEENPMLAQYVSRSMLRQSELTFKTLWDLFITLSNHHTLRNRVLVIDALDECTLDAQYDFKDAIETSRATLGFRLCITARPENIPLAIASTTGEIFVDDEALSADVTTFLNAELGRERNLFGDELASTIRGLVEEGADGMFLVISLRLKDFQKALLQGTISTTPTAINAWFKNHHGHFQDYYGGMIDRILTLDEDSQEKAATILKILLVAQSPLDADDLSTALALAFHDDFTSFAQSRAQSESGIFLVARNLCGSLVKTKDDKMTIVHQSAREYLQNPEAIAAASPRRAFIDSLNMAHGNMLLSRACIKVLLFPDVEFTDRGDFGRFPLLLYSLMNWQSHVRGAGGDIASCLDLLELFFKPGAEALLKWIRFSRWTQSEVEQVNLEVIPLTPIAIIASEQLTDLLMFTETDPATGKGLTIFDNPINIDTVHAYYEYTPLYMAIVKQNEPLARKLLDLGADPNIATTLGFSPLHASVILRCADLAKLLLKYNADINQAYPDSDNGGELAGSPIYVAAVEDSQEMVALLLDRGAHNAMCGERYSALHIAADNANLGILQLLLSAETNADVNMINKDGMAALHYAASSGPTEAVQLLIEKGASVTPATSKTILHEATLSGHSPIVELLLKHGAKFDEPTESWTPLSVACLNGFKECATMLLEAGANVESATDTGETPLLKAARKEHFEIARILIEDYGANVNALDEDGKSALFNVCCGDSTDIFDLILKHKPDLDAATYKLGTTPLYMAAYAGQDYMVTKLIAAGAALDIATTTHSRTPLHAALIQGHPFIAKDLIQAGADVHLRESDGQNGLMVSALCNKDKEVLSLLIDRTDDLAAVDTNGNNALMLAASAGFEGGVELLLGTEKFDTLACNHDGESALYASAVGKSSAIVDMLLMNDFDADKRTKPGFSVLHAAAQCCDKTTVGRIARNTNWNWRNHSITTPIAIAAAYGMTGNIEALLEAGMPVDFCNSDGVTALHTAVVRGHEKAVRLLLDHGADVDRITDSGQTAYVIALGRHSESLAELVFPRSNRLALGDLQTLTTPLASACTTSLHCAKRLLDSYKVPFTLKDSLGETPLHEAVSNDQTEVIQYLLENDDSMINSLHYIHATTPLINAAQYDYLEATELLLLHGADQTVTDFWGFPAIFYAARYNPLFETLQSANPTYAAKFFSEWDESGSALSRNVAHQIVVLIAYIESLQSDKQPTEQEESSSWSTTPGGSTPHSEDSAGKLALKAAYSLLEEKPSEAANSQAQAADSQAKTADSQTEITDLQTETVAAAIVPEEKGKETQLDMAALTAVLEEQSKPESLLKLNVPASIRDRLPTPIPQFQASDRRQTLGLLSEGLMLVEDYDNACTAFEAILGSPSDNLLEQFTCFRCRVMGGTKVFVCKSCPLRVMCKDCKEVAASHGYRGCKDHEHIELPRDSWVERNGKRFNDEYETEEEWLANLRREWVAKMIYVGSPTTEMKFPFEHYKKHRPSIFDHCRPESFNQLKEHLMVYPRDVGLRSDKGLLISAEVIANGSSDAQVLPALEWLTSRGAKPLFNEGQTESPVQVAIRKGYKRCTEFLLEHFEEKFNEKDKTGPRLLKLLLKRKWETAVQHAVVRHFDWVAQGEWDWLRDLSLSGRTDMEIAQDLIGLHLDMPWVQFDTQDGGAPPVNPELHKRNCLHFPRDLKELKQQEIFDQEDDDDDDYSESQTESKVTDTSESSGLVAKVATRCGLGGALPGGRGSVEFDEADPSAAVSFNTATTEEETGWDSYAVLARAGAGLVESLALAQQVGICCSSFTIIHRAEGTKGPDEHDAVCLDSVSFDLVCNFVRCLREPRSASKMVRRVALVDAYGYATSLFKQCGFAVPLPHEQDVGSLLDYCSLAMQILCTGFVSFCGGHMRQFHIPIIKEHVTHLTLKGCTAHNLVFEPRKLTCVGDMLKDEVMTFSYFPEPSEAVTASERSRKYHLIAKPIDIHELWGPANLIFPQQETTVNVATMELRGGHICVEAPKDAEPAPSLAHWAKGICDLRKPLVPFELHTPVCVGTLQISRHQQLQWSSALANVEGTLRILDAERDYYEINSYRERMIGVSQYVSIGAVQGDQRRGEKDQKQAVLRRWNQPGPVIPWRTLDRPWGLVVSACTGVAKRVPLRVVVSLALTPYLDSVSIVPDKDAGYTLDERRTFEQEFIAQLSDTTGSLKNFCEEQHPGLMLHAKILITDILNLLEHTGVNDEGSHFRIACPWVRDLSACIETSCAGGQEQWAKVLQDSARCATFAIFTPECLQTPERRCLLQRPVVHSAMFIFLTEVEPETSKNGPFDGQWTLNADNVYHIRKKGVPAQGHNFTGHVVGKPGNHRMYIWNVSRTNLFYGRLRSEFPSRKGFIQEKQVGGSRSGTVSLWISRE